MKPIRYTLIISLCFLVLTICNGCSNKEQTATVEPPSAEQIATEGAGPASSQPTQLPVRYQNPGYVVASQESDDALSLEEEEYALKVGANITSTRGPQPLRDILKRLANIKGMSVSWASDVNQDALVDVNLRANDNFYAALRNLLRQVNYFYEIEDSVIIVKYKDTKTFHIALPFMKGTYTTTVGGNFLTARNAASGTEGTVKITSDSNEFDIWENIKLNLDSILEVWSIRRELEITGGGMSTEAAQASRTYTGTAERVGGGVDNPSEEQTQTTGVTERSANAYYTIDKSVGLITVTAPQNLLGKVANYLENLQRELHRQVIIEAKIIEVYLKDNSKIGLDWSAVLKNFSLDGIVEFGTGGLLGQVYPQVDRPNKDGSPGYEPFLSKVSLAAAPFKVMLNALNEQGDAKVLSNPKLTVLNGQPALISVGRDIAYIKTVSKNVDSGTGTTNTITYTAEVDNIVEGVAMGVVASIIDDDSVILHLTPITTDLLDDTIEYRTFGDGLEVGLPKVGIREMSTMVKVNNGEMLIIGGLIDKIESKTGDFAPILGNIPIIRYLFGVEEKKMEKRELVILLTPRVI